MYSGFEDGQKIFFQFDKTSYNIPNTFGNVVWLKVTRKQHNLTAFASANGKDWTPVGESISLVNLDKTQPNYNSWVGTSLGLFTEGKPADFDFFICKDGFSALPAVGFSNYYGVEKTAEDALTNDSENGGWLMISGVDLDGKNQKAKAIEIELSATSSGKLEIWLDDLTTGKLIATVPFSSTNGMTNWKVVSKSIKAIKGQHDVFVKFPKVSSKSLAVKYLKFK